MVSSLLVSYKACEKTSISTDSIYPLSAIGRDLLWDSLGNLLGCPSEVKDLLGENTAILSAMFFQIYSLAKKMVYIDR